MLGRRVKAVVFTDSNSLFDTINKLFTVSEKRLLIDIAAIRENHTKGDLSNAAHVASVYNIANVFTKDKADQSTLLFLMETGYLSHPISQWIIPQV